MTKYKPNTCLVYEQEENMNALTLLNNFERELTKPFFRNAWLNDYADLKPQSTFSSVLNFDEKASAWTLTVEMAGVTKDNLKINTLDGSLRLEGEKTKGVDTGKFELNYRLPQDVDAEKIEAVFEDGILNVSFPLVEKKAAKTIQIK